MNENTGNINFSEKKLQELISISGNCEYYNESIRMSAIEELKKRGFDISKIIQINEHKKEQADRRLKISKKSLKIKNVFGLHPNYKKVIHSEFDLETKNIIAKQVLYELEWILISDTPDKIVAQILNLESTGTNQIVINMDANSVTISSKCIERRLMDFGRNSKNVQLFEIFFQEIAKDFSDKKGHTSYPKPNYKLPDSLPSPFFSKGNNNVFLFIAGILIATVLGIGNAFYTSIFYYIFGLHEVINGILAGFLLSLIVVGLKSLKNSPVFFITKISTLALFLITYICRYLFFNDELSNFNFVAYLVSMGKLGIVHFFNFESLMMIGIWILQIVILYFSFWIVISLRLTDIQVKIIPPEVIEFTVHLIHKGFDNSQIREELAARGWVTRYHQDVVFDTVSIVLGKKL